MPISRRHFLASSLALPAFAKKVVEERPNILLLVADDLPSWMMSTYGNKEVKMPNLTQLGQMGTHFLNHFTAAPAAAPGFASVMTGRSPMQLGDAGAISAADATLEKVLAAAGYACHSVEPEGAPALIDQPKDGAPFFLSVRYSALELPYGNIPSKYLDLYSHENFENYSVEIAAANARSGKELLDNRVANLRKVAAAISMMDDSVGALTGKIFQKQLLDRTVVVFTSTCGALLGRHGLWDAGDASEPVNMYDESVRVPLLWSWPGHVPAQEERMELVSTYDLLPTVCDLVSASVPSRNLCGRSYLPLATGKRLPKKRPWRNTLFGQYRNTAMARTERYNLVIRNDGKGPNELFDLPADPGERSNQIDNEQYISVKNTLSGELAQWKRQYAS
ncbi:MAG TPA: sulfatase-like hydrolase/transferase [Bryobacteraceae bacterium]|jgi:arylsulfatase A-like enzyme